MYDDARLHTHNNISTRKFITFIMKADDKILKENEIYLLFLLS